MAEENQLPQVNQNGNPVYRQIKTIYRDIPLPRKIMMGAVVVLVLIGFIYIILQASKTEFQILFSGLSSEDAAKVVEKLDELKIPYQLTSGGTVIMVPAERVYDIRLKMAGEGLPQGSNVGFEIFDETDFGTTEFVQKLNYQRALQGELARTIQDFREVESARVMIVMPKESVFIEDSKPPSASVLLKLKGSLSSSNVTAIVNLVASAVQGLEPSMITIVDTQGNVLSKGVPDDDTEDIANKQLEYKNTYERNLAKRIQSMLERIVGDGKAIVRVTADMDFSKVDVSEEIFDPDAQVIRSRHYIDESADNESGPGDISSVNPVVGTSPTEGKSYSEKNKKHNETVNYEINKIIRRTTQPVGSVNRLSVAAVLDGTYTFEADEEGNQVRTYVKRTDEELAQFRTIVQQAMGYSEDREDQVSVESFPFSYMAEMEIPQGIDWMDFFKTYWKYIFQALLVLVVILFVVLPLIKSVRKMNETIVESAAFVAEEEAKALAPPDEKELLPDVSKMTLREKAAYLAQQDLQKATNIMRLWLKESE